MAKIEIPDVKKQKSAGTSIAAAVKLLIKKAKEDRKKKKKGRGKLTGGK